MHLCAAVLTAIELAVWIVVQVLFVVAFGAEYGAPYSATLVLHLMFSLVYGLCANGWYLSHARRKIADARARGLEGQHLLFTLQHGGGTSWPGFFAWSLSGYVVGFCFGFVLGVSLLVANGP